MSARASTTTAAAALTVVIVEHDDAAAVLTQLGAYRAESPELFEAIDWRVMSNGSTPPPDVERAGFGRVRVRRVPNRGYAAAITTALAESERPFVLASNADLVPEPGFLARVTAWVAELRGGRSEDRVGVVGFGLLDPDGSPQGSAGPFPTLARLLLGLVRSRAHRKYFPPLAVEAVPCDVPWVTGAAMLIDRRLLDEVGPLDERFFLYYEDVDLCRRAWSSGWRVVLDPSGRLRHLHPYHSRPLTGRMVRCARRAVLLYFTKHRPRWEARVLTLIVAVEATLRRPRAIWRPIARTAWRVWRDPATAWDEPVVREDG